MRWYIIMHPRTGQTWRPFVIATSPDEAWAQDQAFMWNDSVALSQEEALLDPDLRDAVLEFDAGDDRLYAEWRIAEEADIIIREEALGAATEHIDRSDPAAFARAFDDAVPLEVHVESEDPERHLRHEVWEATIRFFMLCEEAEKARAGLGRASAYDLAQQLKHYAEETGRKLV